MKKFVQTLCSILFATAIASPSDALPTPAQDLCDSTEEQIGQPSVADNYHLRLIMGDFGIQPHENTTTHQDSSPMLFVSSPAGKIVKDAQVVMTIIAPDGQQRMCRALPFRSGYLVPTWQLAPGHYLLEAEIVTDGYLLTDLFSFEKA